MRFLFLIWLLTITFTSCEFSVKTDKKADEKNISKIRNGIEIQSKGIKVEQAFLLFEDGNLIPEGNKVKVNQKVRLRIVCSGWKAINGKVFLSGAEIVETSEGDVILNDSTLLKDYTDGIALSDAEYLTMHVVINQITKLYDYYKVIFRLSDLNDKQNVVEGFYKLYLN